MLHKKVTIFAIFIATILLVSGCGSTNESNNDSATKVANKIQNAINKNKAVKCVSKIDGGKSVTYIQGKNIKTEIEIDGKTRISVTKNGEETYSWTKGEKQGQKFTAKCMKEFADEMKQPAPKQDFEATVKEIENNEINGNLSCESVAKIDFSVPSDITFTDQCEQMKKQMKQIQERSAEAQKQMEEAQKQMQNMKLLQ